MSTFEDRGARRENPEFYVRLTDTPVVVCVPTGYEAGWWSYVVLPQPIEEK